MDDAKRELKGSEKRDTFKQKHKALRSGFYATDVDFCLVSKHPPGVVAYIDYKDYNDCVSFSEALAYNEFMKQAPVYIIQASNPEIGPFVVQRYRGANWKPDPPDVDYGVALWFKDWQALGEWEKALRDKYRRHGGWNGNLPVDEG